jgi:hypothetical protein
VEKGMVIGLDAYKQLGDIKIATEQYVQQEAAKTMIHQIAEALVEPCGAKARSQPVRNFSFPGVPDRVLSGHWPSTRPVRLIKYPRQSKDKSNDLKYIIDEDFPENFISQSAMDRLGLGNGTLDVIKPLVEDHQLTFDAIPAAKTTVTKLIRLTSLDQHDHYHQAVFAVLNDLKLQADVVVGHKLSKSAFGIESSSAHERKDKAL